MKEIRRTARERRRACAKRWEAAHEDAVSQFQHAAVSRFSACKTDLLARHEAVTRRLDVLFRDRDVLVREVQQLLADVETDEREASEALRAVRESIVTLSSAAG